MLVLENARFGYPGFTLSADVTFAKGKLTAIMGPSGGGKSTLLAAVAGFLPLKAGRVSWAGQDITAKPVAERPVSMIFQEHNLFPHLSAAQNVGLGLDPSLRLSADQKATIEGALDAVGLAGFDERKPAELSGGQRGRVALARVLVMDRPILLLDEPFAALGPALRSEMLELVAGMAKEKALTVLMVTHSPEDAQHIAEETALVAEGRVSQPVRTQALFEDPPEALRAYLG